ncbi:hypothetical protein GH714_024726 [Hevea brasiliensis]|uniref:FRIGIDA-like protein n=1 Tax=Hevea brasiliensis TaxID=3981 RepID=A0A6A6M453_HEVBR|nr:hypothetical protein GH714_024726 [Hevea brasiliensis]
MKETEVELIEKSIRNLSSKLQAEEKKLDSVQKLIEERLKDLGSKEKHLDSIKMLIEENAEELEAKEKQHDAIKNSINDCCAELTLKEKEMERIEKSIIKLSSKLQLEEKKLHVVQKYAKRRAKEFNLKEKELSSLKDTMKTYCVDLELKDREYNAVRESIGERNEELKLKKELLQSVQTSIIECSEELEAMKKQRSTVQKSIAECSEEFESKKKSIDLMEKSLKECSDNLALKEAELDSIQRFHKEHEEKKNPDEIQSLLDTVSQHRQAPELRQAFGNAESLSGSNNSFSHVKVEQMEHLHVSDPVCSSSANFQSTVITEGSFLLFQNEELGEYDLKPQEVLAVLKLSPDPAKFVLDVMQGSYFHHWKNEGGGLDASVFRSKVEAIGKEVAALRTILECVADYKLESRFPTQKVTDLIVELEKQRQASEALYQPLLLLFNHKCKVEIITLLAHLAPSHRYITRTRGIDCNSRYWKLLHVSCYYDGETISSELNLSELRKQSIRRTIDQLQDRASSILMLTLQWREREEHFESTHNAIDGRAVELHAIQESVEQNLKDVKKREKELEVVQESVNGS